MITLTIYYLIWLSLTKKLLASKFLVEARISSLVRRRKKTYCPLIPAGNYCSGFGSGALIFKNVPRQKYCKQNTSKSSKHWMKIPMSNYMYSTVQYGLLLLLSLCANYELVVHLWGFKENRDIVLEPKIVVSAPLKHQGF